MKIVILCIFILCFARIASYAQQVVDTTIVIHFGSNVFTPDDTEIKRLDAFFRSYPNAVVIHIAGHTDTVGSQKTNLVLSGKRSRFIADRLKKYRSLQNVRVENFGETMPVSASDNALNRRVEVSVQMPAAVKQGADTATAGVIRKYSFDKLYFQPDRPVIEDYSLGYVDDIARILKTYQDARFEIRGHVNCPLTVDEYSGYMQKMNRLSSDRAKAVYEMLIDRGIPARKMTYKGMGNTQMLFPDASTDEEKRKNMRVEILVLRDSI